MTGIYHLDKKMIWILFLSGFGLVIGFFFLGLSIGISMNNTAPAGYAAPVESTDQKSVVVQTQDQTGETASPLAKQTQAEPISPAFEESAPTSQGPELSQAKE